ncbi:MAG: acetoacetyl-CoA synthetase [Saprospiraceae bacterium]|jgi:acetoacetyl-CoA synthetase
MKKLWSPSLAFTNDSNMNQFMLWVNEKQGLQLNDYHSLWNWSVKDTPLFWSSIFDYFQIMHHGTKTPTCTQTEKMIGTRWFPEAKVNYAEHVFRNQKEGTAIEFLNEQGTKKSVSWKELEQETSKLVSHFKSLGLGVGSKVAAFLPNIPEAIIGFLACNAIGAIWSSCSPDFGTASVLDRFQQIKPDVLLVANGYWYNGKVFDKSEANKQLVDALGSLKQVISINYCSDCPEFEHAINKPWTELKESDSALSFERVNFNDPIWVLYSSGTTGLPKAITHSVGGILIEHFKAMSLHQNVKQDEVFFWFSTTGWMMWNYANAALLVGATVAIYDGSPAYPNLNTLWDYAAEAKMNHFGAGASFYISCMKQGLKLNNDLPDLSSLGSTGSPLTPDAFLWIYKHIKNDLWLISLSGGTDVCSGFVGGNPFDDVVEGEIQCRMLGVDLHAYNESGEKVIDELGEMVIDSPLPSMPIYFWNDKNNKRYQESYFEMYPEKWRHGDWIKISKEGSVIIFGRSDSTLNRGGVRIGTSEIYNATETFEEIKDSVVVCVNNTKGDELMLLFVVLKEGVQLNAKLKIKINKQLIRMYSPRHMPDQIIPIQEVPYTMNGKKMETPIKKILSGKTLSTSTDAMKNPESLKFFQNYKL